ncbi:carbohydrate ABC transporter membrane protein 2 (CUT1 family) [Scopulibacillus darangshiensis]|uniref:Carbohydrate ABC transporter membrane protein 2 (CUT1 family) n=1 Tax=Scopulibacillus darangshiensis TaxID=442528 RepID=A0A4R2NM82_9BACL|nr:carbohydrate ABC transporter permease [Scopulibacillus darangshiensis]TCP22344.1 carbohydrate ABC transporter membrane protein 2 (CUT1 family) [Scopulibacillus darangshiensis]
MKRKLSLSSLHILLLIIGLIWIYPFIWMISASLKKNFELISSGLKLLPEKAQWVNYARAWNEANFSGYFLNTVIITIFTVLIILVMCALTGYALARVDFPGKKLFILVITGTMFIPKGYTIIPIYIIIKQLGLLNTLGGVILAESSGAHVLFILLFMAYFSKLPKELEESAIMDGCGFFRTFWSIMLPLSKPIIATVAIMQFIWTWNSFFIPFVFTLNKPELRTLAVGMYSFVGEHSVDWVGMTAAATISLIPVIIIFIVFQRFFIEGVSGSVKG